MLTINVVGLFPALSAAGYATGAAHSLRIAAAQTRLQFYVSAQDFQDHMVSRVDAALALQPDLIVLPEHFGTGLVALGADPSIRAAQSLDEVMGALLAACGEDVQRIMAQSQFSAPRALLLAQAEKMREVYCSTFSTLAREHGVYIAAGTVALPHENEARPAVYNTFFLFGPDGALLGTADKVNLIPLESEQGLDLAPGDAADLLPWRTDLATFGPVICLDGWDAELIASLTQGGAQVLLEASANPEPWSPQVIADRREGLFARVRELAVPGAECFGVGVLASLPFEGVSRILAPDPTAQDGVRVLAKATSTTEEEVIVAEVELPGG